MAQSSMLDELRRAFGSRIESIEEKNPRRSYVRVAPADLPGVARRCCESNGRLAIITGIDTRAGVELLYHFFFAHEHHMITLKVLVKKPRPSMISLAPWLPAADWAEREIHDLLGVTFEGHPDPRRLLLADSWPQGVHPLRRNFEGLPE